GTVATIFSHKRPTIAGFSQPGPAPPGASPTLSPRIPPQRRATHSRRSFQAASAWNERGCWRRRLGHCWSRRRTDFRSPFQGVSLSTTHPERGTADLSLFWSRPRSNLSLSLLGVPFWRASAGCWRTCDGVDLAPLSSLSRPGVLFL